MALSLTFSIISTSLILYLGLTFLGNDTKIWVASLAISLLVNFIILRRQNINLKISSSVFFILLILAVILIKAFVISPLVITKSANSFTHIQITDVGDYYKHSFVVNSLAQSGIPPTHPYFPSAKLSYYFGYYLIPASLTKLFNIEPHIALYFFVIITDFLSFLIILNICRKTLKTFFGQLVCLLLVVLGAGVNTINTLINSSIFDRSLGLSLNNSYIALLYAPQHLFAAALTVGLIYQLLKEKPNLFATILLTTFIVLSSTFVSITLFFWLILIFIFHKDKRWHLIKAGIISLLLLIPYFLYLSGRENLLYPYQFQPFPLASFPNFFINNAINSILTFFIQYGPIFMILPLFLLHKKFSFIKNYLPIIMGISLPLIVTWFIRSPNFNDFSMRTSIPIQLILPVLFVSQVEQIRKKFIKLALFFVCLLVIILGTLGFFLEYSKHWKSRTFLQPKDSELIFNIRKLPSSVKIASVDRDRWVELIPSLGNKLILSPYLFDSYVYLDKAGGTERGDYERVALDLFLEANTNKNLQSLIEQKNSQFKKLKDFFNRYKADLLIVNNQLWIKEDLNPWLVIFTRMGVQSTPLTPYYTTFDYSDLLQKLAKFRLSIPFDKGVEKQIAFRKLPLQEGLWYIATCTKDKKFQALLEFEDYYQLFNQELNEVDKNCVGKMFYLSNAEDTQLTTNSTVTNVNIFPVEFGY